MAKQSREPDTCEYLAIVSEWSSATRQGGIVGNAYPIVNLTLSEVVAEPREEFPNPGAVFLLSRGQFKTWDYIIVRPRRNDQYKDDSDRACYYIPGRTPELVATEGQLEKVAIILNHPTFNVDSNVRHLLNPTCNVTPYFFVQKNDRFFGPLFCVQRQHTSTEEEILRIDWRAVREDGIIYEFTLGDLQKQGLQLFEYKHPDAFLNRVISTPIKVAFGDIAKVASVKPWDTLTDAGIVEWYLQRCPGVDVSATHIMGLKSAFKKSTQDDPAIVNQRLRKVERSLAEHAGLAEYRDRIIRNFLESEAGRKRVQEVIEQTVVKKAAEIQEEVDRREKELSDKRKWYEEQTKECDNKLAEKEAELTARIGEKEKELQAMQEKTEAEVNRLKDARETARKEMAEFKALLKPEVEELRIQIREHVPLLAALAEVRPAANGPVATGLAANGQVAITTERVPVAAVPSAARYDFPAVTPTKPLAAVAGEPAIVNSIHASLTKAGLHFSRDFIANVYTCLKSEALNLIIGPPGYGKSMLITHLATALGHESAFLRIAVRRSWAEDRFLLGAFDNFHGRYDPGTTGLVERMLQAEADWKAKAKGIYLVLLDEFNLAAPEYYFSQLLQTLPTDEVRRLRELRLYERAIGGNDGFPNRVVLSPNLRFWGTINYDETTERLSPRVLDRTGMIFLGEGDVPPPADDEPVPSTGVPASEVFDKYLKSESDCPDEQWDLVKEVIDLLRRPEAGSGPRIELSPRVHSGIRRYLANSAGVLPSKAAVDYVIQQRILPVVRGRGDDFLVRVRQLHQLLAKQNLPRSAKHVEEAIRRSEQHFGELDFLSY